MTTPSESHPEEKDTVPLRISMLEAKLAEAVEQIARLHYQLADNDLTKEGIDDIREQLSLVGRVENAIKAELAELKAGSARSREA